MHSWKSGGLISTVQEEKKIKTLLLLVLSLLVSLSRERQAIQPQERGDQRVAMQ